MSRVIGVAAIVLGLGCGGTDGGVTTPTPAATLILASISPRTGPASTGNTITLTGSGFQPGARVSVGSLVATNVSVVDPTRITASLGGVHAAGLASVTLTNPDGRSDTIPNAYTYQLQLFSITPSIGSVAGGTLVTITGAGFRSGASVTFNSVIGSETRVVNVTTVTTRTPARQVGLVDVDVDLAGVLGGNATLPLAYSFVPTELPFDINGVWSGPASPIGQVTIRIVDTRILRFEYVANNAPGCGNLFRSTIDVITPVNANREFSYSDPREPNNRYTGRINSATSATGTFDGTGGPGCSVRTTWTASR